MTEQEQDVSHTPPTEAWIVPGKDWEHGPIPGPILVAHPSWADGWAENDAHAAQWFLSGMAHTRAAWRLYTSKGAPTCDWKQARRMFDAQALLRETIASNYGLETANHAFRDGSALGDAAMARFPTDDSALFAIELAYVAQSLFVLRTIGHAYCETRAAGCFAIVKACDLAQQALACAMGDEFTEKILTKCPSLNRPKIITTRRKKGIR